VRKSTILSFAATALIAASSFVSSAAPAAAYQPFPTNHLSVASLNITSLAKPVGPGYYDMGDLQAGRYAIVTASGITDGDGVARAGSATTIVFHSINAAGVNIEQGKRIQNGVPTLLDFGVVANPNGDAELMLTFYAGQKQSNVKLDVWSPNL
jgi:hypothetical protein